MTYSKSSTTEGGLTQNPATKREGLIQNPAAQREQISVMEITRAIQ